MTLFQSNREKWLWLSVFVLLLIIYSTLGVARDIAGYLKNEHLLGTFFYACSLLIGVGLTTYVIKSRSNFKAILVFLGVALLYFFLFMQMDIPEERTHIVEYGIVALLIHQALLERYKNQTKYFLVAVVAVVLTFLAGAVDEVIQEFLPTRYFDVRDILFNGFAGVLAIFSSYIFRVANQFSY